MVEHGHPFQDIRGYNLGQLGLFVKNATLLETMQSKRRVQEGWLAANLNQQGLETYLKEPDKLKPVPKKAEPSEVKKDWNRLASFFAGVR